MLFKKILLYHIIPALLGALICFGFVKTKSSQTPNLNFSAKSVNELSHIVHFKPYDLTEQVGFSIALKQRVPVLMGSSELTSDHLDALAHRFFNRDKTRDKFLSLGHAGFQSFGILTVLAANRQLLKGAKITIILSPGWFEEQYCKGTSLKSFFEFATPNYMYQVLSDTGLDEKTKQHFEEYVNRHYDQMSSPDAVLRLMAHKQSSKLNQVVNWPFTKMNEMDLGLRTQRELYLASQKLILQQLAKVKSKPYYFYPRDLAWDSLITDAKLKFKTLSNNNEMAVENGYYDAWLKNKHKKRVESVPFHRNQEYKDLEVLLNFLKMADCKPLFVIMPLNTKAHENLGELKPTIDGIIKLLKSNNLNYLDMFSPNLRDYEDGILEDIMHPYNAGWYQIDRFILDNYHDGNK